VEQQNRAKALDDPLYDAVPAAMCRRTRVRRRQWQESRAIAASTREGGAGSGVMQCVAGDFVSKTAVVRPVAEDPAVVDRSRRRTAWLAAERLFGIAHREGNRMCARARGADITLAAGDVGQRQACAAGRAGITKPRHLARLLPRRAHISENFLVTEGYTSDDDSGEYRIASWTHAIWLVLHRMCDIGVVDW